MSKKQPTNLELKIELLEMREEIREEMRKLYAEKRVELLVYGMIGIILITVIGAVIAGVIK
jgi:hypothetical protein